MPRGTPTPERLTNSATGNCYPDAANNLLSRNKRGDVVVHGRPTLQAPPFIEYGHAWIENGEEVFDPTNGYRGPRFLYYAMGQIDPRLNKVYTAGQLKKFLKYYGHYGPWEGVDGVTSRSKMIKQMYPGMKKPRSTRKSTMPRFAGGEMMSTLEKGHPLRERSYRS